jgi:hypothetical protein
MKAALPRLMVFFGSIAVTGGALAQEPAIPAGHWASVTSETYSTPLHPVVTGAEFYLVIDVANDGSFRGEWGEYSCAGVSLGAFGFATFPCRFSGTGAPVSGRFSPGREGVIDLSRLGRSAFSWSAPVAGELAIDLPKDWRGDAVLWRARLTRDGRGKPPSTSSAAAGASPSAGDAAPLLSANLLYREFDKDSNAALARHAGKTLVLEGRRGTLIELSDGGAAIHIADGFRSRALVLVFDDLREVSGITEGAQFRFRCTVESFDYLYVHLEGCSIVR